MGRVGPASPIELTTSRTGALQARRSCASSLETFTQSFLHCADAFILIQRMVASAFSTLFIYPKYLVETKQLHSIDLLRVENNTESHYLIKLFEVKVEKAAVIWPSSQKGWVSRWVKIWSLWLHRERGTSYSSFFPTSARTDWLSRWSDIICVSFCPCYFRTGKKAVLTLTSDLLAVLGV